MAPEFGVSLQSGPDPVRFAQLAEEAGFDYLSCGEHLFFHGPTTNAFVALSVAAGATRSIRLVSAITLLPLYAPVVAAKLATSVDVMSGGRFTLGVGVGGEFADEFAAAGVDITDRGRRTDEALQVVHRLMTEDRVDFQGEFANFSSLTLAPKPVQRPRVPFWIAGRKPAAMRRAARFGDGWMPYMYTPEMVAESLQTIDRYAREDGRGGWTGRVALLAFTTVYPDGDHARQVAAAHVGRNYRQDFSRLASRYLIAGTPEECAERARAYLQAGVDTLLFRLACPQAEAEGMLQLLAEEVVPQLR